MGRNSISVVMATYNGEAFLQEQLESIASQSRPPDEMIIADDASQDATLDIVRKFRKSFSLSNRNHRAREEYRLCKEFY